MAFEFTYTDEQQLIKEALATFCARHILPIAEECDEQERFPIEVYRMLGRDGFLGAGVPEEYEGSGGGLIDQCIITEEVSKASSGLGCSMCAGAFIIPAVLWMFGTEEQKKKYAVPTIRGEQIAAIAITEPNAGSDVRSIKATARLDGDSYVINGQKMFSTGAHLDDYQWTLAKTDPQAPGFNGFTLFIVDLRENPGITIRPLYLMDDERTNEVFYDNVRVPSTRMVGEKNKGFYAMAKNLGFGRNFLFGFLRRIFDELIEYVKDAERDGQLLREDPLVRQKMGQIATKLKVGTLLSYRVAWLASQGIPPESEGSMMKVIGVEFMEYIVDAATDILGLDGQLVKGTEMVPLEGRIEQLYRHSRRRFISHGTNEIMRNTIARRGLGLPRE